MNLLTKFYALTLSLAATVIAITPATAANLGLFELNGTARSLTDAEQQLSGTFNTNFTDFDIAVTNLTSGTDVGNPSPVMIRYRDETGTLSNRNSDGNISIAVARDSGSSFTLFLNSPGTITNDIVNLEVGQSFDATWRQSAVNEGFVTGFELGQTTITAVPEPGEIVGVLAAGAMLGGVLIKRRKN